MNFPHSICYRCRPGCVEILANNIAVAITAADIAVFKIAYIPVTSTTIASMKLHIGIVADATAPNIADDLPIYSGVTFFIKLLFINIDSHT